MPITTGDAAATPARSLRQRWISACARTDPDQLHILADVLGIDGTAFDVLRPAENGLVMVRGRAGGTGQLFNAGEMTVTRCSVRGRSGHVGHGYVAGRDKTHAELAARLDAHFQAQPDDTTLPIVAELEQQIGERAHARQQKSAPTRVEFFTMVRGEDE
ncbi:MAG: phosphonate C-P lyase system protein PhnG [Rhodospirillales bacterium]|nr:phosphonate C-P lyase system protein PhnG [Rhodospirillales bacterium]MBO6785508.1 phosphonate C-P lyase system protein PhnG [Rhodospirillales bacterium]